MALEGFKRVSLTIGYPAITFTKNGMTFNKASITKLNGAERVVLLVDEESKRIAIQVCTSTDEESVPFVRSSGGERKGYPQFVRWSNHDLLHVIAKMMEWDIANQSYKVTGEYSSKDNAIIYDLKTFKGVGRKRTRRKNTEE